MQTVKIKKLREDAVVPSIITKGSAGYDVCVAGSYKLKYGRQIVPLGFAVEMPKNMMMYCQPKSGMSAKGLTAMWGPESKVVRIDADVLLGLIDSDYRGEVGAIIDVKDVGIAGGEEVWLPHGLNIAQVTFHTVPDVAIVECDELSETNRGGGFGHEDEKRDNR